MIGSALLKFLDLIVLSYGKIGMEGNTLVLAVHVSSNWIVIRIHATKAQGYIIILLELRFAVWFRNVIFIIKIQFIIFFKIAVMHG